MAVALQFIHFTICLSPLQPAKSLDRSRVLKTSDSYWVILQKVAKSERLVPTNERAIVTQRGKCRKR